MVTGGKHKKTGKWAPTALPPKSHFATSRLPDGTQSVGLRSGKATLGEESMASIHRRVRVFQGERTTKEPSSDLSHRKRLSTEELIKTDSVARSGALGSVPGDAQ